MRKGERDFREKQVFLARIKTKKILVFVLIIFGVIKLKPNYEILFIFLNQNILLIKYFPKLN